MQSACCRKLVSISISLHIGSASEALSLKMAEKSDFEESYRDFLRFPVSDKHIDAMKACLKKEGTSKRIAVELMGMTDKQADNDVMAKVKERNESEKFSHVVHYWILREASTSKATLERLLSTMKKIETPIHQQVVTSLKENNLWPSVKSEPVKQLQLHVPPRAYHSQGNVKKRRSPSPKSCPPPLVGAGNVGGSGASERLPEYSLPSSHRGKVLIINVKKSRCSRNDLKGYDKDASALESLFDSLRFDRSQRAGLTAKEIRAEMKNFCGLKQSDCGAVFILSHGGNGTITGSDGEEVNIEELIHMYEQSSIFKCKPKLLFIQACAGDRDDQAKTAGSRITREDPITADILLAQSCCPNYKSYAYDDKGSVYIQKLVEVIRKYHLHEDLLSMMTIVHDEVARAEITVGSGKTAKQMPRIVSTLRKKLFL
eukprot:m.8499 g.8499  ORF g.8499 m.8499 type:complete len:429 (+) comp20631_c0_seq2:8-1294(+)